MLKGENIIKKIKENPSKLKEYHVSRIGLFGSYKEGKQTEESDVDILVEFEQGKKTFDNYMGLKIFLEDLIECEVDLVVKEAVKPRLKKKIFGSVQYA